MLELRWLECVEADSLIEELEVGRKVRKLLLVLASGKKGAEVEYCLWGWKGNHGKEEKEAHKGLDQSEEMGKKN